MDEFGDEITDQDVEAAIIEAEMHHNTNTNSQQTNSAYNQSRTVCKTQPVTSINIARRQNVSNNQTNECLAAQDQFQDDDFDDIDFDALENEARIIESRSVISSTNESQSIPSVQSINRRNAGPKNYFNAPHNTSENKLAQRSANNTYNDESRHLQSDISGAGSRSSTTVRSAVKRPSTHESSDEDTVTNQQQSNKLSRLCNETKTKFVSSSGLTIPRTTAIIQPVVAQTSIKNSEFHDTDKSTIDVNSERGTLEPWSSDAAVGSNDHKVGVKLASTTHSVKTEPPFTYLCFLPTHSQTKQVLLTFRRKFNFEHL